MNEWMNDWVFLLLLHQIETKTVQKISLSLYYNYLSFTSFTDLSCSVFRLLINFSLLIGLTQISHYWPVALITFTCYCPAHGFICLSDQPYSHWLVIIILLLLISHIYFPLNDLSYSCNSLMIKEIYFQLYRIMYVSTRHRTLYIHLYACEVKFVN